MPILSNLNRPEYYDDFDPNSNYYRTLFRAGKPVQARELTGLQSNLQNQIEELASKFFGNGDTITNGEFNLTTTAAYVRLSSITQGSKAKDFIGYEVKGVVSGVVAEVNFAEEKDDNDDYTLYINYISSGVDNEFDTFIEGETLESNHPNFYTATVGITGTTKPIDTPAMGYGSLFTIEPGSMYVNGTIVRVAKQTISLDKYSTRPTGQVGLIVDEDFVSANEDESLKDNAQGHSNFAAPGADRLRIRLHLAFREAEVEESNFIVLITLLQGNIVGDPSQSIKWDWLFSLLATRTYEESGDYVVNDFSVKPLSYWNSLPENLQDFYRLLGDEDVEGLYEPDIDRYTFTNPYPPVPQSGETKPLTFVEADTNYALKISPGLAYVQGYRVGLMNPLYVYGKKPRTKSIKVDTYTQINPGSFVILNNTYNTPNIENIDYTLETRAFDAIDCYRNFTDGYVGAAFRLGDVTSSDDVDYDRRPHNIGNKPWTTYHIITNVDVDIEFDKTGGAFQDQDIQIQTQRGPITCKLIYPDASVENSPATGALLDNPGQRFIKTESNNRLMLDGGGPRADIINTNSLVVALPPENEDAIIARGDAIDAGRGGNYNSLPKALISQKIEPILTGVIHPKYYKPNTLVNKGSGFFGYNSSYDMGILSSFYYTEFVVIEDDSTSQEEWTIGRIITGLKSGAIAKIEQIREIYLVVSVISGTFISGESIIQNTGRTDDEVIISAILTESKHEMYTDPEEDRLRLIMDRANMNRSSIKRGRIINEGEVIQMKFNSRIGSVAAGELPGGGGDRELADDLFKDLFNYVDESIDKINFTNDVLLTHPTKSNPNLRLPPELGLETQEDANSWFYNAIHDLQEGRDANNVIMSETPPDDDEVYVGDIWVNKTNYVVYFRDGFDNGDGTQTQMWIAVTPGEADENSAVPQSVVTLATTFAASQAAAEAKLSTRDDYSLANETSVIVYSTGSRLDLYRIDHPNATVDDTGARRGDFEYNAQKNSIELTEYGRNRVYKFAFFNPDRNSNIPRVNYELMTQPNYIRGYATSSPAKITNTIKKVKNFHSTGYSSTATGEGQDKFSADANIASSNSCEVYDIAGGSLFSGSIGRNYITCDNFSGDASEELITGDVVAFKDRLDRFEYKIVSFVTKPFGYGPKRTKCTVYFTTTLENGLSSSVVQRLRLKNFGKSTESLIYQLPVSVVSSLETNSNVTSINYEVFREFVTDQISSANGKSSLVFTSAEANAKFISDPLKCTVVVANTTNTTSEREYQGRPIALDQINPIEISDGGRLIRINLDIELPSDSQIKAILPLRITNSKSKRKILIRDYQIEVKSTNMKEKEAISLNVADVYRLEKIEEIDTIDGAETYKDITDNYTFDNGQRDTYYDYGRVVLKSGRPEHINDLRITFDYFEHKDGDGQDFFSVDSYTHDNGVPYEDIPTYFPQNTTSDNQTNFENKNYHIKLRDCVDFRPVINTENRYNKTGDYSGDIFVDHEIRTNDMFNFHDKSVSGNAFVPNVPIPTTQFEADVEYYLPKIDTLFLDKTGKMILKEGESSENPVRPADIATGIRLYDLHMPAYLFDIDDIVIKKYNYRSYTMKDISDIDKRVERVENLVTLSILEQSALNMSVRDAVTGLDRFKNGIVVDPFKDHSKGDVGSEQYRCSIDPKESHLRAPYVMSQVQLEEVNETNLERETFGSYSNRNNIITAEYETIDYIKQSVATTDIDIQKYSSTVFEGKISLMPSIDTFHDTTKPAKLVVDNSDVYSASLNLTDAQKDVSMGTVWTEWETNGGILNDRFNPLGKERNNKKLFEIQSYGTRYNSGVITKASSTLSHTQSKNHTASGHTSSTTNVRDTSFGKRLFDMQLSHTMRSIPVYFKAERLKPNTRYYAFFDDVNVSEWICVDKISDNFTDGYKRYNGAPNSDPLGFNMPLISDDEGNISGVFVIPNGRCPVQGTIFNGKMEDIEYNKSGKTRSFTTGERSFKLSSNDSPNANTTQISGYARANFISSAVIVDKTENVVSTRNIEYTTNTTLQEDVRLKYDGGDDRYNPNTVPSPVPTPYDPLAQTFIIDRNYPDGVFVSELDLYFSQKDFYQGVEAYIVTTDGGVPSNVVVPHSKVVKPSNSVLRIVCELASSVRNTNIASGSVIRGEESGATGVVKDDIQFDSVQSNTIKNVGNTVYNVVLSNYKGEFVAGEKLVIEVDPKNINRFEVAEDEVTITRIDMKNMGEDYMNIDTNVTISEPDLPGGVNATAKVVVAERPTSGKVPGIKGQVYEIVLTDSGSGYTKSPSISISGRGTKAEAVARVKDGRKSVIMGVSTSDDASCATTFRFSAPVYLLGNKSYAFVVKTPTSVLYKLWAAKVGENEIGTMKKVTAPPNTGALFTSQNAGIFTENQNMDLMFNLKRCSFSRAGANVKMHNAPYYSRKIGKNPIETYYNEISLDSDKFARNNSIVRVNHYNHGLLSGDFVYIEGVEENPGNIPNDKINGLHQVIDADLDDFTIMVDGAATKISKAGGDNVRCTFNKPYETINLYSGMMTFPSSNVIAMNRSLQYGGLPSVPEVIDTNRQYDVTFTGYNEDGAYTLDETEDVPIMDSYYYSGAKQVAHQMNEVKYSDDFHMRGEKSMVSSIDFSTSDERVSPVIDLDRTNMTIIHNMIDNPQRYYNVTRGTGIATITFKKTIRRANIFINKTLKFLTKSGQEETLRIVDVDVSAKIIRVEGDILKLMNFDKFSDPQLNLAPVNVEFSGTSQFHDESSNDGSVYSKWISKMFVFDNECDGVEVKLSAVFYNLDDIKVYYKTRNVGIDGDFSKVIWTPFNPNSVKPNEKQKQVTDQNSGEPGFYVNNNQLQRTPGLADDIDRIKPRNSINVDPRYILADEWQELTYSAQDISAFDAISVKIVMTADNAALAPLIDDIRVIASE